MTDMAATTEALLAASRAAGEPIRATAERLQALLADPIANPDGNGDLDLLRCLYTIGRYDLPLGRLFEGNVDAQQIVGRLGSDAQRATLTHAVANGAMLGVWNADLAGEPLILADGRLSGGKAFASGAGVLSHALVTADVPEGRQLLLLDLAEVPPAIDTTWWQMVGMQRSETHLVRWQDAAVGAYALIGEPNTYAREPWFSGGALRFVTVQAGGVAGLFDQVRAHLVATARAGDPHQAGRLADLFGLADLAAGAVRRASAVWLSAADEVRLAQVAAARVQVARLAEEAISIAQQAVGLQGLFHAHPLSAALTDLMVYLRQPAPDAQRMRVGAAVADAVLVPAL